MSRAAWPTTSVGRASSAVAPSLAAGAPGPAPRRPSASQSSPRCKARVWSQSQQIASEDVSDRPRRCFEDCTRPAVDSETLARPDCLLSNTPARTRGDERGRPIVFNSSQSTSRCRRSRPAEPLRRQKPKKCSSSHYRLSAAADRRARDRLTRAVPPPPGTQARTKLVFINRRAAARPTTAETRTNSNVYPPGHRRRF